MGEMKNNFDVTTAAVTAPANMLNQVANSLSQNAMTLSSSIADVNTQIGNIGQQAIKIVLNRTLGLRFNR